MHIVEAMLSTWREAASDLSVQFTAPFALHGAMGEVSCFGHLPEFGSPRGIVVFTAFDAEHCKLAQSQGYAFSCTTENAEPYDREGFEDMLNDWGWSVEGREPPSWYSGKPWSR